MMQAKPTLICIPDISGFTEFMGETNFELSSKVIPSLLNNIIYSNEIGLKVSEIEGDAVLFYKQGELPPFSNLMDQCLFFYNEFYHQLETLRKKHHHMEEAQKIPEILGLKIVLHYGKEVAPVKVGARIKLLGEDLIVAHRLLKNDIQMDEYLLFSDDLVQAYTQAPRKENLAQWQLLEHSTKYPQIGRIKYHYTPFKLLEEGH